MSVELDRVIKDAAAQKDVIQSLVTLVQGYAAEVRNRAGDPAGLMALAGDMEATTAAAAAAVVANTPVADGTGTATGTTGDTGTGNTGTTGTVDTTSGTGTVANPAPTTDASGPTVPNPNPNA